MARIDFHGVPEDQALETYAEQRIRSSVGHLEHDLDVVTVCLTKEGYRGGLHARCRMVTRPVPWADVVVEETDVDPYAAIDRSAERLADIVAQARGGARAGLGTPSREGGIPVLPQGNGTLTSAPIWLAGGQDAD